MTALGIDPGLGRMGYAVVRREGSRLVSVEHGLIETPPIALPDRLMIVRERVAEIVARTSPDEMAVERLLFAANKTTALDVAKALGVALLAAAEAGLPVTEYSPPEVKRGVVGNGRADKKQVQFMVTRLLSLRETPRPDDVADAVAVAITHLLRGGSQAA